MFIAQRHHEMCHSQKSFHPALRAVFKVFDLNFAMNTPALPSLTRYLKTGMSGDSGAYVEWHNLLRRSSLTTCQQTIINAEPARNPFTTLSCIFPLDGSHDPAAGLEARLDARPFRLGGRDKIIEDAGGEVFVEYPDVAEGKKVEFEGFKFDAKFRRPVIDADIGEIRKAGLRAQARKLVRLDADRVILIRILVLPCFYSRKF